MSVDRLSFRMPSRHLDQEVGVARWGSFGTPVLLFPTAAGDAEECERFLMIRVLEPLLASGRIKIYSCDSVGGRALTERRDHSPGWYPWMQNRFDAFLHQELVPWIQEDCRTPGIGVITAGASIGAFNAVASLCRHPDVFSHAIGMSGTYDVSKWLDPFDLNLDFYFSSPIHFLPKLDDEATLRLLRKRFVLLPTGEGDYEDPSESWRMAHVLGSKGIPNRVDPWGPEWRHDWVTWRAMLPKYLDDLA